MPTSVVPFGGSLLPFVANFSTRNVTGNSSVTLFGNLRARFGKIRMTKLSLFCSSLLFCSWVLSVSPASAQGGGAHPAPAPAPTPTPAPASRPTTKMPSNPNPWGQDQLLYSSHKMVSPSSRPSDCFLPPLNGMDRSSVGVTDLQAPSKAQGELRDGCAALRNNKAVEAEAHLRKAVKEWPKYSGAWIVLGQVLESQRKLDKAYDACSQPLTTDSKYLPAYLCLADVSAHTENWNQVFQLSNRALEIDSNEQCGCLRPQCSREPPSAQVARRGKERPKGCGIRQEQCRPSRTFSAGSNLCSEG